MKSRLHKLHAALAITMVLSTPLMATVPAYALFDNAKGMACQAIGNCSASTASTANSILAAGLNVLSIIAGVAAVIMIVIAGIKYTLSGGESNSVSSAKSTLIYALVGLIIVAMAQSIVHFALRAGTPCPTNASISAASTACKK